MSPMVCRTTGDEFHGCVQVHYIKNYCVYMILACLKIIYNYYYFLYIKPKLKKNKKFNAPITVPHWCCEKLFEMW